MQNAVDIYGNMQVGTQTVSPSGYVDVQPLLSDQIFRDVCVTVVPIGDFATYHYEVQLTIDGETEESHIYADANRHVAHMALNNKLFPPNVGLKTQPAMVMYSAIDPKLSGIHLIIINNEPEPRQFVVHSTFACLNSVYRALWK